MNEKLHWYRVSVDTAVQKLQSNASCGLSRKEARSRCRSFGANTLFDGRETGFLSLCKPILTDPALLLMLFVCILSFCFSEVASALATAVCLFGGVGFALRFLWMEKKTAERIAKYRIPNVYAIRDGKVLLLSARAVTVGDVLLLRRGDIVPCDCRLISSSGLRVLTLIPDENGKPKYEHQIKNADAVYPQDVPVPQSPENMLLGGAEILEGEARAIAVAVGKDAFLSGFSDFEIPAERTVCANGNKQSQLFSYLRIYGFLMFVLMIPFTVLGILTAPDGYGVWNVFQTFCALSAVASPAFLTLLFRTSDTGLQRRYLSQKNKTDCAVIKNSSSMESLASITDVIALGHAGFSDETPHLHRVVTGAGEYDLQSADPNAELTAICEAFLLLDMAKKSPSLSTVRRELASVNVFDSDAMDVRLLSSPVLVASTETETVLDIRMRDGDFQLRFSEHGNSVEDCTTCRINGKIRPLGDTMRRALIHFAEEEKRSGNQIQILLRREGGAAAWTLLGIVVLREQVQKVLPSVLEELRQCGVAVTFFVPTETESERAFLSSAGFSDLVLTASECREKNVHPATFYGKYRVFAGFSQKEILEIIAVLKKNGRRVAVLGERTEDLRLLQNASVALAFDDMTHEAAPKSNAVRRRADVLIPKATEMRGGLFLLLRLIADCRARELRNRAVLRFLYQSSLFRVVAVCFAVLLGLGGMSGIQILFSGFWVETLGVFLIYTASLPQNRLRKSRTNDTNEILKLLCNRKNWLSPFLSATISVIYAACLRGFTLITVDQAVSFLFCSFILLQIALLWATLAESRFYAFSKRMSRFSSFLFLCADPTRHGTWCMESAFGLLLAAFRCRLFARPIYSFHDFKTDSQVKGIRRIY